MSHISVGLTVILVLAVVFCALSRARAADLDLAHYRDLPPCSRSVPVPNGDFSDQAAGWTAGQGLSIAQTAGRGGTPCLRVVREDRESYVLCDQRLALEPGATYRFSAWVKAEGVTEGELGGATIGLECYAPHYLGGAYPEGVVGTTDWTKVSGTYTVPRVAEPECLLRLYLRRSATGRAWFDDVRIEQTNPEWDVYLISPAPDHVPCAGAELTFGCFPEGAFLTPDSPVAIGDLTCRLALSQEGQEVQVTGANPVDRRLRFALQEMPPGPARVDLALLDPAGGWIVARRSIELTFEAPRAPGPNACLIDRRGRLLVGGKPFMPVALYHYETTPADLDRIAASPFNCLMDYAAMRFRLDADPSTEKLPGVRKALDALDAHGLKAIFSVKDVWDDTRVWHDETIYNGEYDGAQGEQAVVERVIRGLRDHPAIIAWYMNDEFPPIMVDQLLSRRRLINRLDPDRPAWSCISQYTELPRYGGTCDVLGLDPYPIIDDATRAITPTLTAVTQADLAMGTSSGFPFWGVPQAHNLGFYDPERNNDLAQVKEKWRDPSETEMLAQALVMAIHGAKGFVYYSYYDLITVYEKRYPKALEESERRWSELCRVAATLRSLEPYLMSEVDGPAVKVTVEEGQVVARAFRDDSGRACVLVAGIGPGPARALIEVPGEQALGSRFGNCEPAGVDVYQFTGSDVCCDILDGPNDAGD